MKKQVKKDYELVLILDDILINLENNNRHDLMDLPLLIMNGCQDFITDEVKFAKKLKECFETIS